MEEAQDTLEEAREPLSELQDLDVDEEIIQYSVLLSESVSAQLSAENREIEFYGLLEQDPTLADTREEAVELLAEVGDGYEEARSSYDRAQELAAANPDLIQES
jgi:predicted RNase H-like HicB family nuclease